MADFSTNKSDSWIDGRLIYQWTDRPTGSERAAAYHVGRIFNCFGYSCCQAYMLYAVNMKRAAYMQTDVALRAINELGAVTSLMAPSAPEQLRRELADFGSRCFVQLFNGGYDSDLLDFYAKVDAIGDEVGFEVWRRELSYEPIRIQTQLREKLELRMNGSQRTAFSLGAHLDAGVRPPDVYLRMFDAEISAQCQLNFLGISEAEFVRVFKDFDEEESAQHEIHTPAIKEEGDTSVGRLGRKRGC